MVVGIAMVKDEADVIERTVAHMLGQVDRVIVADNGSTDGTFEALRRIAASAPRLEVLEDGEPGYYQAEKMTDLAERAARLHGAEWVVPFDADEVWLATAGGRVADALRNLDDSVAVAPAEVYDHRATGADPSGHPFDTMRWRIRAALPLPKVACRPAAPVTIAQGNHGASYPTEIAHGHLAVRHFPYRSGEQFVSKVRNGAAAYAATDLPEDVGAHWRQYGRHLEENGAEAVIDEIFRRHFWVADPTASADLVLDPCPVT